MNHYLICPYTGSNAVIPQIEVGAELNIRSQKKMFQLVTQAKFTDYISYYEGRTQIVSNRFFEILKSFNYPIDSKYWEYIDLSHKSGIVKEYVLLKPPVLPLEYIDFSKSRLIVVDMLRRSADQEIKLSSKEDYLRYDKHMDRMERIKIRSIKVIGKIDLPWIRTPISNSNYFLEENVALEIERLQFSGIEINELINIRSL